MPILLTDGDGNPATGPEPTIVVVGNGQQLSITKQVAVVGGGPATAGGQLEYLVRVTNVSTVPALYVVITDDLDANGPGYLTFVDQSATLNGSANGISIAGPVLTADYSTNYGPLAPGATAVLRFRATIAPNSGDRHAHHQHRRGHVEQPAADRARERVDRCRRHGRRRCAERQGVARRELQYDLRQQRARARGLDGRSCIATTCSALGSDGRQRQLQDRRHRAELRDGRSLRAAIRGAGRRRDDREAGTRALDFTNDLQRITDIVVQSGSNLQDLNLPISPNGVVYNTIVRTPVAGATLTTAARRRAAPCSLLLR